MLGVREVEKVSARLSRKQTCVCVRMPATTTLHSVLPPPTPHPFSALCFHTTHPPTLPHPTPPHPTPPNLTCVEQHEAACAVCVFGFTR